MLCPEQSVQQLCPAGVSAAAFAAAAAEEHPAVAAAAAPDNPKYVPAWEWCPRPDSQSAAAAAANQSRPDTAWHRWPYAAQRGFCHCH